MEAHLGDQVDERLEQLAFYFYRSDETDKGLAYLERAAEHAVTVEALGRAEQLWERARRLAERVGDEERVAHVDRQARVVAQALDGRAAAPARWRDGGRDRLGRLAGPEGGGAGSRRR